MFTILYKYLKNQFEFQGLKTGLYYLRTRPAADPIKFTVDKTKLKSNKTNETEASITKNKMNGDQKKLTNGNGYHEAQESAGNEKELASNDDLIEQLKLACSLQNKEACMMCSS